MSTDERPEGLPDGVVIRRLATIADERGQLAEVYRREWCPRAESVQWNCTRSHENVLRGVHVHVRHEDYLFVASGRMLLGLCDIRKGSATNGLRSQLTLDGERWSSVSIPTGVAHGFYFLQPSLMLYGLTESWDPADELGCRWDDPALGLDWPATNPILSRRDRDAVSFADMVRAYEARASEQ